MKSNMASLVADYGSEDDSEEEINEAEGSFELPSVQEEAFTTPSKNFFMPSALDKDDTDDNSDDEDEESCGNEFSQSKGDNSKPKLPNPLLDNLPISSPSQSESAPASFVFVNQFDLAEKAKHSILEKHVKMTDVKILTGKQGQVCWKFKKGKCRFGKNCKYSHDIDNLSKQADVSTESTNTQTSPSNGVDVFPVASGWVSDGRLENTSFTQNSRDSANDDSYMSNVKRKKRPGVSDTLVPPKKAMSALNRQRAEDRPWTVNK